MVSTSHLIKDQVTGRHLGGAVHGTNPFNRSFAFSAAGANFGIGAMASAGVGLNAYGGGCPRCGPGGCRCFG